MQDVMFFMPLSIYQHKERQYPEEYLPNQQRYAVLVLLERVDI